MASKSASMIEQLLREIGARNKFAEIAETPTSHPVGDTPGGVVKTPSEEDSENNKALKAVAGPAAVKGAGDATVAPPAEGGNLQVGTIKKPTGEDPENETPKKMVVSDPGTSHPAKSDSSAPGVAKFAYTKAASTVDLATTLKAHADAIVAALVVEKAANQAATPVTAAQQLPADVARQSGWELAGLAAGDQEQFDKVAIDNLVREEVAGIIKAGQDDAMGLLAELHRLSQPARPATKAAASCGGGSTPVSKKKPTAKMAGEDEGGEEPEEESEPAEPAEPAPEGPPSGGGGGEGGGAGGGAGMAELEQIMASMGITPEDLIMALSEGGGGGAGAGGGAPPAAAEAGGGAGMMPPPPGGGMEVTASQRTKQAAANTSGKPGVARGGVKTADRMKHVIGDMNRRGPAA